MIEFIVIYKQVFVVSKKGYVVDLCVLHHCKSVTCNSQLVFDFMKFNAGDVPVPSELSLEIFL